MCVLTGNRVALGQNGSGDIFPKLGDGGVFWDISNRCISKTVGDLKTHMEVLGRLRPHFLESPFGASADV